jgi:hypothetical protein
MNILDQFSGVTSKGEEVTFQLVKLSAKSFQIRRNGLPASSHTNKDVAQQTFTNFRQVYEKRGGENTEMQTGKDEFTKVGEKLKAEKEEQVEKEVEVRKEVKNQLAALKENPVLAELYKQNAQAGATNLGGSVPYLRIHTANSMNLLADGTRPQPGSFYYAPTKQEFPSLTVHILTISRGFRILRKDEETGEEKMQFNQIVAGVFVDAGKFKPFFMYVNGLKLRPVWDFGKEMGDFTRAGYPMFSIVVEMTTEEVKTEKYGYKWIPKLRIARENGNPEIVLDVPTFNLLLEGVKKAEERLDSIIQANESQVTPVEGHQDITGNGNDDEEEVSEGEVVSPGDIPF